MCAAWLTAETFDGIRLGLVGLEHGQQLRNGEQILNALRRQFQREYEVYTAASAEEAYSLLAASPIQVVISDQQMPA